VYSALENRTDIYCLQREQRVLVFPKRLTLFHVFNQCLVCDEIVWQFSEEFEEFKALARLASHDIAAVKDQNTLVTGSGSKINLYSLTGTKLAHTNSVFVREYYNKSFLLSQIKVFRDRPKKIYINLSKKLICIDSNVLQTFQRFGTRLDVVPFVVVTKKKKLIKDFMTVSAKHMVVFADNKIMIFDDCKCTKLFVCRQGYDNTLVPIVIQPGVWNFPDYPVICLHSDDEVQAINLKSGEIVGRERLAVKAIVMTEREDQCT